MRRWGPLISAMALVLCLALPAAGQSRRGELRGVWIDAAGEHDWAEVVRTLSQNGFNAVFASFSSGAIAYYPSHVLSHANSVGAETDELATAAGAASDHGVELHVRRTSLAVHQADSELLETLEQTGRLQRSSSGKLCRDDPDVGVDWLCPSHPDNRALEKAAALELVQRYDIAGVQLDSLRFPGPDYCFCDQCRKRFERDAGGRVPDWPDDVLEGGSLAGRWRKWRRDLLTALAEEIAEAVQAADPDALVSLAAWPNVDEAGEQLGQDWPTWIRRGAIAFICPKNSTPDREELARLVREQVAATRGEVPLYTGVAAHRMNSAWALIGHIDAARAAGADGFIASSFGSSGIEQWLPDLRATVAAAEPNPMPHHGPPARFACSGPAMESPAKEDRVVAGATLEAETVVGWRPPEELGGDAGAEQAGVMLENLMKSRTPVPSYEPQRGRDYNFGDEQRISGRIVVENASGRALLPLGAFDTDAQFQRTLRFPAPTGPFRIAVYGSVRAGDEARDFVARGPLFVGMQGDELRAEALRAELKRVFAEACGRREVIAMAGLSATFQVRATGPGGGDWWVRIGDGSCQSGPGIAKEPDLTFTASAADVAAIASGAADPKLLYEAGDLAVSGDRKLLRRLAEATGAQ